MKDELSKISYWIRITFLLLSIFNGVILFMMESFHRNLMRIHYGVPGLQHDRLVVLLRWRRSIEFHVYAMVMVLSIVDQVFIESLMESTYAWALNPLLKVGIGIVCFLFEKLLKAKTVGNMMFFYYRYFVGFTIFFSLLYAGVLFSYFFDF